MESEALGIEKYTQSQTSVSHCSRTFSCPSPPEKYRTNNTILKCLCMCGSEALKFGRHGKIAKHPSQH